jgi:hypothetical protein
MMTKSVIKVMRTVQEATQTTVLIGFSTVVPHLAVNSTMIVKLVPTNHSVDTVSTMIPAKKVTVMDLLMVTVMTGPSAKTIAHHLRPPALADETQPPLDVVIQPQALDVDLQALADDQPQADDDLPLEVDQPQADDDLPLDLLVVEVLQALHRWSLPQLHSPLLLLSLLHSTFK